jgi:hypothetical protein
LKGASRRSSVQPDYSAPRGDMQEIITSNHFVCVGEAITNEIILMCHILTGGGGGDTMAPAHKLTGCDHKLTVAKNKTSSGSGHDYVSYT